MAERLGVAVVVIRHLNKSAGSLSIYRGGGSIGIIGAARCGLLVAKDPEDENKRVFAGIKSNLGPIPPSLAFHIDGSDSGAKISWDGPSTHSADSILAASPENSEDNSALEEACEFLQEILSEGSIGPNKIFQQAKDLGISKITLLRAKKKLGFKSQKDGFSGKWFWIMPTPTDPEGDQ